MRFDDLIADALDAASGDFVSAVEAAKLVARVEETEPEALTEWLTERAIPFVTMSMTRSLGVTRQTEIRRARARLFTVASAAAESGDPEPLRHFEVTYVVDDEQTRRHVADMTGPDHRFVADGYHASGTFDLMLESFHRAVAKKVGSRRTADVLTEEKYDAMLRSILGERAA